MSLRDLYLKAVYRSDRDHILEDFYIPALSTSIRYDRAVGFFSAGMLSYAAQGLSAFVHNAGQMRLIIGGELQPQDEQAIQKGYDLREIARRIGTEIIETIERVDDPLFFRRIELLSWLIASGRLDIKLALKRQGMYHEKIGIFTDSDGDKVVFQGSANETTNALLPDFNFESINVFQCWREELKDHFSPYVVGFEDLWQNKSPNTLVLDFPDAAKEKLIKIAKSVPKLITPNIEAELWRKYKTRDDEEESESDTPVLPSLMNGEEFEIKPHQKRALEAWKANGLQGVMALATGAGKTITAIYGAVKVFEATKKLILGIAVPYQNLADQWVSVLREFNITPIQCYADSSDWLPRFSEMISLYQANACRFVCFIVVNRTLQSDHFQSLLTQIPGENFLWVGDECHHHSTTRLANALPQQAQWRLGLSATPEHYLNQDATARIFAYYGQVVASYTLAEALTDGVLTPYRYHVVVVDLADDEAEEYQQLSEQISMAAARQRDADAEDEKLKMLLFRRARLLGRVRSKLTELRSLIANKRPTPLTLFYCGDGSTEDEHSGEQLRQVELVSSLLFDLGWKSSHFTSHEPLQERQGLLDYFRIGLIDALVAIRCLDEGIDVPACRRAYILASSRNPKQFIQRRGRILRRSPGKEYAEIYDFLVKIPNHLAEGNQSERKLIIAELERVAEFARLATNSADAVRTLLPLLKQYDLAHVLV
jgi:superfamily II DNA or RNA helicase